MSERTEETGTKSATVSAGETRRLVVYLIKPSHYDDEGYIMRHFHAVIPSNTLATLAGLTEEVRASGHLGEVELEDRCVDEAVQRLPYRKIRRAAARKGNKVVICLCGVQTNQFPRARDLALRFRKEGLTVIIGGFHVSGANVLIPGVAPEIQELLDNGVTVVRGEVEGRWGDILEMAAAGTLPLTLDLLDEKPELHSRPVPVVNPGASNAAAYSGKGAIETGRGCPFSCSFCTIINVQGRRMRCHSPEHVLKAVEAQYRQGSRYCFFTDDNFARNPEWERIFDGMAEMRARGMDITFMMQVDILAARTERFVEKAQAAGCVQVFIGVESLNERNLVDAGKKQNKVADYKDLVARWREAQVVTHAGYIIGFPHDTPESMDEDIRRLRDEIGMDMASFFILTPLPGSEDHARAVTNGVHMDADFNNYDSVHAVMDHPRISREQVEAAFRAAWKNFYTVAHMKKSLAAYEGKTYWTLFSVYLWARVATEVGEHPMMSGLYRLYDRTDQRPGHLAEDRLTHLWRKITSTAHQARLWLKVLLQMEEVWLASRRRETGEGRIRTILRSALRVKPAAFLSNCAARFHRHRYTRKDLAVFWRRLNRFSWLRANPLRAPMNALREGAMMMNYLLHLTYGHSANARRQNVEGLV